MPSDATTPNDVAFRCGMPSAVVAVASLGIMAYGLWWQPSRLPSLYRTALSGYLKQFESFGQSDNSKYYALTSSVNLCYLRLEALGEEVDLLEKVQFYESASDGWQARLTHVGTNETYESQQATFIEIKSKLYDELSAVDSPYFRIMNRRLAETALLEGCSTEQRLKLIENLKRVLAKEDDQTTRVILVRLLIEQAWSANPAEVTIRPDTESLKLAATLANEIVDVTTRLQFQLEAGVHLDYEHAVELAKNSEHNREGFKGAGIDHVSAILADWKQVEAGIAQQLGTYGRDEIKLRSRSSLVAKQIIRLLFSRLTTNSSWCSGAPSAVRLAEQLESGSNEFASFVWQAAENHAQETSRNDIPSTLLEAILISGESQSRYLILSLSSIIRELPKDATIYFDLASKSNPRMVDLTSQVAYWYASRDNRHVDSWLVVLDDWATKHQKGGFYLAAAVMRFKKEDYEAAQEQLAEAQRILGDLPVILKMQEAIKSGAKDGQERNG